MSIRLMTDVWDIPGFGAATTRLVLLALADQANDEGLCWPFMATIASRADCGLSTARKAVAELEGTGWLRRELRRTAEGDNDRSLYQLNVARLAAAAGAARIERGSPKTDGGAAQIERGGPLDPDGGAAQIERHNRQENPHIEPSSPDADAPDGQQALIPAPEVPKSTRPEPTVNQRANVLAQRHYERLGKMGNVPAFLKIARQALNAGYSDERVDQAMAYLAQQQWTLTAERLRNTLEGGPRRPTGAPPTARPVMDGRHVLQEG